MGRTRYTVIGMVFSKVGLPLLRKYARRRARGGIDDVRRGAMQAVKGNPGRVGIAVGTAAGAVWYLLSSRSARHVSDDLNDADMLDR